MKIAIDGFAGSGKSTIAKQLSKDLGFLYIDTGAMYRMITLYYLDNGIDFSENLPLDELEKIKIEMDNNRFFLNDLDVSDSIRSIKVSQSVSAVSALPNVRKVMVRKQRELANDQNVILDGRDIGSVVFPTAEVKIFLTASTEIRARRRLKQLADMGKTEDYDNILDNIKKRDYIDSNRENSPLIKVVDAIEIDSSYLTEKEVYEKIKEIILRNIN